MADLNLNDQPTATDSDSIIIAVQEDDNNGNKVWRKLTPLEMVALYAIGGLTDAQERLLAGLPAYLNDLLLVSQEVWNTATDMQLVSLDPNDAGDTRNIQLLAAGSVPTLTGWAAEITTTQNEVIVARIPLAMNAEDYRIQEVRGSGTTSERLQNIPERARNSQYKFISTLNTEIAGAFTAQHHGVNHHTEYDGTLGDRPTAEVQALIDALATAIMARLLPDPSESTAGFVPKVNSALNGFILGADETAAGGGGLSPQQLARLLPDPAGSTAGFVAKVNAALNGYVLAAESGSGLTNQEKQIIQTLQAKTADLLLQTSETWVLATDAQFAPLANNDAAVGRLLSNQVPTGIAAGAWTNDQTTTQDRVVIVRVPMSAQIADYRLLFGDNDPIRLDSYALYATGSQYAYYASTAIANLQLSPPGRIRLQYHGASAHTKYIGALGEDYVTEQEFRDRAIHTPDRGDTLPVHLPPQGTFVLEKTSHWSDKLYAFYPATRDIVISGQTYSDYGTIEILLSSDWTSFEDDDNANPAIFSGTRVAGIVMRWKDGTTERWQPKVILDRALFPSSGGSYDYSGLSIRMALTHAGHYGSYHDARLLNSAFDADGDVTNGTVTELVSGGRTYVCFVPDNRNFNWNVFLYNAVQNNTELAFQILKSKTASPVFPPTDPQFLSDDPATPWVDGNEFETGLYEGDANGHPRARILPPLDDWNDLIARGIPYFRGTAPNNRFGRDGQWWFNSIEGKLYNKVSGAWQLVTDLVIQAELQAAIDAIEASGGADGRVIFGNADRPGNDLGKVGDVYIRRLTLELGLYEKTGAEVWTYRYGVDILPSRPTFDARDRLGLFWDGNALGWSEAKAVFAELGISASLTIPQEDGTAIPLTYASALVENHNATNIISRASAGNAITLKSGSYTIDVDMNVTTPTSGDNARSNVEFTIYNGSTLLKTKRGGYLRSLNTYNEQVASARFTLHFASDTTIQIRVKLHDNDTGDPSISTQAGGSVTVVRIGI